MPGIPRLLAAALAAGVLVVAVTTNSWSAGASDSYSYVSQMDLWLRGDLTVDVDLAGRVPWPNALATFTPFGYSAVANQQAITPVTGPGLPLLMAAFKLIAGHSAAFLVVPLTGALLVWATFLIGTRLRDDTAAVGAAWLVATSPTFLMMFKSQMSDAPAAAFWALATYWILGTTVRGAIAAGLAASLAILIRPNVVPLAAVLLAWTIFGQRDRRRAIGFAAATLPGCVIVAVINRSLFGSALSSGYGELASLFALSNVGMTLSSYARWLIETQTPLVFPGIALLLIAPARVWPDRAIRNLARLLGLVVLMLWTIYATYPAFDAWWFLRFLLPTWPAMFIGTAALITFIVGIGRVGAPSRVVQSFAAMALIALGAYGIRIAMTHGVFPHDEGERRYADVAQLVQQQTEPDAMILASIHAGSLRYYGGRATMRFDLLEPEWLDRATEWLHAHGRHPYVLVEDWEMPAFRERFSGRSRNGDLNFQPAMAYYAARIPGRVYLFDLERRDPGTVEPPPVVDAPLCPRPAAPPKL